MIFKYDLDNCLYDLSKTLVMAYNFMYDDKVTNYYSDYWFSQCKKADQDYFQDMLNSQGFFLNLIPMREEINLVNKLYHQGHKIIFVTRPCETNPYCRIEKLQALENHFSDIEFDVAFTKDKYLIKADFIIDDDPQHLNHPEEKSIKICYGDYGWNKEYKGHKATNVKELESIIIKLQKSIDK